MANNPVNPILTYKAKAAAARAALLLVLDDRLAQFEKLALMDAGEFATHSAIVHSEVQSGTETLGDAATAVESAEHSAEEHIRLHLGDLEKSINAATEQLELAVLAAAEQLLTDSQGS